MRSYIEKRLENLIGEHANGQTAIRNLEAQLTAMRETVTRINGAITLCQEALRDAPSDSLELAQKRVVTTFQAYEAASAQITKAQIAAATALADNANALDTVKVLRDVPKEALPCPTRRNGTHGSERCDLAEGHNGDCKF